MNNIFFTSDTHFGHRQKFLHDPRGFSSIEEHDEEVIRLWNEIVDPDDIVYHLGDVMLNDNKHGIECLQRLNGEIRLIRGNHDTDARMRLYESLPNVTTLGWAEIIKYKKYNIYLSHHPTITSNHDIDKPLRARLINICGHSHTQDKFKDMDKGIIYHAELDAHNNQPICIDDIIEDIKKRLEEDECTKLDI